MTFVLLGACVSLAAWTVATLAGAVAVMPLVSTLPDLAPGRAARGRERALLALRLLPSTAGLLAVCGLVVPAWVLFEPLDTRERPGPALVALACVGAALLVDGLVRGARQHRRTGRVVTSWERQATTLAGGPLTSGARCVDWDVPFASAAGVWRPRLYVERRVLTSCDDEELEAILAHEGAHVRSRDNLKRVLLGACPDPLARTPWGARLDRLWSEAAEAAADEEGARAMRGGGAALASALLRMTRIVPSPVAPVPGSPVLDGAPIASRVERLLAGPHQPACAEGWILGGLVGGLLALLALGLAALPVTHSLLEAFVSL